MKLFAAYLKDWQFQPVKGNNDFLDCELLNLVASTRPQVYTLLVSIGFFRILIAIPLITTQQVVIVRARTVKMVANFNYNKSSWLAYSFQC
jgi:hypothetical protein